MGARFGAAAKRIEWPVVWMSLMAITTITFAVNLIVMIWTGHYEGSGEKIAYTTIVLDLAWISCLARLS